MASNILISQGVFFLMVFRASADFHALFLPRPYYVAIREVDHQHFCSLNSYELPDGYLLIPKNILGTLFITVVAPDLNGNPGIARGEAVGGLTYTADKIIREIHLYSAST